MSRVLLGGVAPLPFEELQKNYGPGIRTWQFARGLVQAGHEVQIVAMRVGDAYTKAEQTSRDTRGGVEILRVDDHSFLKGDVVGEVIREYDPEVLVGATIYGSNALARHAGNLPLWADQFGHVMAEAQAKAALDRDNRLLSHFWGLLEPVLRRADKFSVVSGRQRLAAIGELGAIGRLTAETCGYEFIEVLPCSQDPYPEPTLSAGTLRSKLVPEDAFVVLWSGSYNVWSDVDVIYRALTKAMSEEPRIHFVSTGAEVPGYDESTYQRFKALCATSEHRQRFHLLGWRPTSEIPSIWNDADLGVLTERAIYEGELGSKNRVVQWLAFGLPVAYNRIGDLGDLFASESLGAVFPVGDVEALSALLVETARNPRSSRERAVVAKRYVAENLSYAATTAPLCRWVAAAERAPDAGKAPQVSSPEERPLPTRSFARRLVNMAPGPVRGFLRRVRSIVREGIR